MDSERKLKGRPILAEKMMIIERLKTVLDILPPGADGKLRCRYQPGWSDQRIGDELGFTYAAIQLTRQAIFGKIKIVKPAKKGCCDCAALQAQIDSLRKDVNSLLEHRTRVSKVNPSHDALGLFMSPTKGEH